MFTIMDTHGVKWLRWAFNCKHWIPTASEWLQANRCIQKEELTRIERFVFQAPAITALVGRLLLRKSLQTVTGLRNSEVFFSRTGEGRPYVEGMDGVDVNISHHGDWVVLALERQARVGIDVMSLDRPINIELAEYFRLMRRQFTPNEWEQIEKSENKLHEFYRFWCLKESYVKATGVGLNLNLQLINFTTRDKLILKGLTSSTKISLVNDTEKCDWFFEETLLDSNHCVSVCTEEKINYKSMSSKSSADADLNGMTSHSVYDKVSDKLFTELSIEELLCMEPINPDLDTCVWNNFNNKKYSPG